MIANKLLLKYAFLLSNIIPLRNYVFINAKIQVKSQFGAIVNNYSTNS